MTNSMQQICGVVKSSMPETGERENGEDTFTIDLLRGKTGLSTKGAN
jgi:hypothetical protein